MSKYADIVVGYTSWNCKYCMSYIVLFCGSLIEVDRNFSRNQQFVIMRLGITDWYLLKSGDKK